MFKLNYYPNAKYQEMLFAKMKGQSRFELSFIFNDIIIKKGTCSKSTLLPILQMNGRRGRDHMVVGFTTTQAISVDSH